MSQDGVSHGGPMDSAPATAGTRRSLALTIVPPVVLPAFLAAADGTLVSTALPAIAASFGEVDRLSWLVVANLIASTVAAPAYGRLADRYGRGRMLLVALTIIVGASLICVRAPNFDVLLIARVLQGLGGGGLVALTVALTGEYVPLRERGTYQGYFAASIAAGAAFGPAASGFLTGYFGWRAVFLIYAPLGLLAMLLIARLPRTRPRAAPAGGFDLPGLILLTAFVVPLLIAVSLSRDMVPAMAPRAAGFFALACAALGALVWQQRRAAEPILAPRLLAIPAFWRADVIAACSGAGWWVMATFLPLYSAVVLDSSPEQTGLLIIPLTVSVCAGAIVTGRLMTRTGHSALFPMIGQTVTAIIMVYLAWAAHGMTRLELSMVLAVAGFFQGTGMPAATIIVQQVAGPAHLGTAAASAQLARSLGSAFGTALAAALLFATLAFIDPDAGALFAGIIRHDAVVLTRIPAGQAARQYAEIARAFGGVFLLVAGISSLSALMAATLPVRRLDSGQADEGPA